MKKLLTIVPLVAILGLMAACSKTEQTATAPHATILLRDGSIYSGALLKSNASEVTLAGDDKTTRTFSMKDVRSIDLGDQAAAPAPAEPPQAAPATSAPAAVQQAGSSAPARQPAPMEREQTAQPAVRTASYDLPAGTQVSIRTDENIDSSRAAEGQTFAAEVGQDVRDAAGVVVIPRGANAKIVIRSASAGGTVSGSSNLVLDLESVSIDGRQYRIETADISQSGRKGLGKNKRTAEFVGGGAALGAVIGAIAGHGRGAAIGALSGAAAGGATQVLTRGRAIKVPAETVLTFRLETPLRVVAAR